MINKFFSAAILCVTFAMSGITLAQTRPSTSPATEPSDDHPDDHLVVTEHDMMLHGQPFHYQATAGTIEMKDEQGEKPRANMFFIAYRANPHQRPDHAADHVCL